jgi:purine-nucleoside phosphorylase
LVASHALAEDGASTALGATGPVAADRSLTAALAEAAEAPELTVASVDLFYEEHSPGSATRRERPAAAVEMEAATLFRLAQLRHARAACLLAVTDVLEGGAARRAGRLGSEEIEAAGLRLGEAALSALMADAR